MSVQYDSLVMVIFNEEQLQRFQQRYYASSETTLFDIAREMRSDAEGVIDSFDFLEFAEALMRQADLRREHARHKDEQLLQRV